MPDTRNVRDCLNCGQHLEEEDHYCPRCGQKKMDHRLSFKDFISEFFSNYLSWDSRLGRSIVPFLFKPGFLTRKYFEGKRMSYVNPIRMNILISFLFFLLLNFSVDQQVKFSSSLDITPDTTKNVLVLNFGEDSTRTKEISPETKEILEDLEEEGLISRNDEMTRQLEKMSQSPASFFSYFISKLPLMMFILMPVYALVLWLFFAKQHPFYLQHLIHTLYIHAFMFLIFGILIVLIEILGSYTWLNLLFLFSFLVYVYISFLEVYKQKVGRTTWKYFLIGFTYLFLLGSFTLGAFLVSVYLF